MTETMLAGFVLGLLTATIMLLVYSRCEKPNGEIELSDELFLQIKAILAGAADVAARLGRTLTLEQVERLADWLYRRFPQLCEFFTQDEWRGLLTLTLLWMIAEPAATTARCGPEDSAWQEFEQFARQSN